MFPNDPERRVDAEPLAEALVIVGLVAAIFGLRSNDSPPPTVAIRESSEAVPALIDLDRVGVPGRDAVRS